MARRAQHLADWTDFRDAPEIEHHDPVAHQANDIEIVRNEHQAQPSFAAYPVDQFEDRRLNGDVERRRRFVQDQQARLAGQRSGDADTRLLAAGQLMRAAVEQFWSEADFPGKLRRPFAGLVIETDRSQTDSDVAGGAIGWIERIPGALKDELDGFSGDVAGEFAAGDGADVSPLESNPPCRRVGEAGDQSGDRRFPGAAFADDAKAFALGEIEVDVVDRMQLRAAADGEEFAQAGDFEKRRS